MNIGMFLLTTVANGVIAGVMLLTFVAVFIHLFFGGMFFGVLREKGISGGAIVLCAFIVGLSIVIAAAGF